MSDRFMNMQWGWLSPEHVQGPGLSEIRNSIAGPSRASRLYSNSDEFEEIKSPISVGMPEVCSSQGNRNSNCTLNKSNCFSRLRELWGFTRAFFRWRTIIFGSDLNTRMEILNPDSFNELQSKARLTRLTEICKEESLRKIESQGS